MNDLSHTAVADAARYFDTWVAFRQQYDRVPGIQAAVLHEDKLLLSTAYGCADVEQGTALTPQHLFRIASHSKTFTATAVLQLVERDQLRLDDRAGRWLPFLRGTALAGVTVRELLGHGGGVVRDSGNGDYWQLAHAFPDEDRLRAILLDDGAGVLPANERFKYSNIGYSMLGLIVAAAADMPYDAFVCEHIVEKLSLENTGPEYDPDRAGDYATGYTALSYADHRIPIDHVDTAAMAAATGFFSTAEDLVHYVAAHFHGDSRLVSDASKRLMQRAEWKVEGRGGAEYGLGFGRSMIGDRLVFGHGGGYPGHLTRTSFDPVGRLAVSVLTNAIDGPAVMLAEGLIRLVNLAESASPLLEPSPVDLSRFTGRFATMWRVFDVVDLAGRLYLLDPTERDPTSEPVTLAVVDDHTLRISGGTGYAPVGEPIRYEFAVDGVASVQAFAMTAHPIDRVARAVRTHDRVSPGTPLLTDGGGDAPAR
ncbi:class A beta-lactamase-related serine hydrolase [Jiangella ureilytica]|uniref:Class A beta-lactamase-related serine hydrolase n=1 Tax=Jiangella ureilytica TaxID=2530374 RepID=A0A4R4RUG3_9ACTN|nr:serine hydrolase domain-containing protein [Jiangella ureilytica]TDC53738.1 class A beta-lactamase-related serine hydrolase [Jiangella ureilytica]